MNGEIINNIRFADDTLITHQTEIGIRFVIFVHTQMLNEKEQIT